MTQHDYRAKFRELEDYSLFASMPEHTRCFLRDRAFAYQLTVQQFYEIVKAERDLQMWRVPDLQEWWRTLERPPVDRSNFMKQVRAYVDQNRHQAADYTGFHVDTPPRPSAKSVETMDTDRKIHGFCPALSEQTVCCNLRTIDAVENCPLGCSYCSIQTFYTDRYVFEENLGEKLRQIPISPERNYHFCTGQSSDSLVWGNRNGNLEKLAEFAGQHPNILLELKTKTDNVDEFLALDIPSNVVVSWTLNPPMVTSHEEHFTASPERRIQAAEKVAAAGLPVAFHFHPIMYYQTYQKDYTELIRDLTSRLDPRQVLFVSMGALTLIKPAINRIRQLGFPTKILQFPQDRDPHGKVTYPKEIKKDLFSTVYQAFDCWHDQVFFYLCMETQDIWQQIFGNSYACNDDFEADFLDHLFNKLASEFPVPYSPAST